jgi:hypothetical protein
MSSGDVGREHVADMNDRLRLNLGAPQCRAEDAHVGLVRTNQNGVDHRGDADADPRTWLTHLSVAEVLLRVPVGVRDHQHHRE